MLPIKFLRKLIGVITISSKTLSLCVNRNSRLEIRNEVINAFLQEEPGTGKEDKCSKYVYEVEDLQNGSKVYLRRPAALNKGVDFTVHVENVEFRKKGAGKDMPSHSDIINDLKLKKEESETDYKGVKDILNRIYNCESVADSEYLKFNFKSGHDIEAILKAIKWLFIEQDVTYWNWSGRGMLFSGLRENDLC